MAFNKNYECIPLNETAEHYFNNDQVLVKLHPNGYLTKILKKMIENSWTLT